MHTGRSRSRRGGVASRIAAAIAVVTLAACGAPARIRTLDGEPDLTRMAGRTIPAGFSQSVSGELHRLLSTCVALDPKVGDVLPDVGAGGGASRLTLTDDQCEWLLDAGTPKLVVGILASPAGNGVLDQTATVITGERSIANVGDRALFDIQTRTLYVVKNGRLWYLQLVGPGNGVDAPTVLTTLARALVQTPAANR